MTKDHIISKGGSTNKKEQSYQKRPSQAKQEYLNLRDSLSKELHQRDLGYCRHRRLGAQTAGTRFSFSCRTVAEVKHKSLNNDPSFFHGLFKLAKRKKKSKTTQLGSLMFLRFNTNKRWLAGRLGWGSYVHGRLSTIYLLLLPRRPAGNLGRARLHSTSFDRVERSGERKVFLA